MKGVLLKRNKNWFIEYIATNGSPNLIQIYPDYVKYYFLDDDAIDGEVYFEIEYINNREYAKLIHPNKLDLKQLEDKLDEALAKETTESLTEWVQSKRKDDIERLVDEEYGLQQKSFEDSTEMFPFNYSELLKTGFIDGYNKAKETLYTEEQMELCWIAAMSNRTGFSDSVSYTEFIKSLKQPKKD